MECDVLIIGAGPGGLRCAQILADHGLAVIVLERSENIGRKVCAGGITWSGLIKQLPETLIEKRFTSQRIQTRWQNVRVMSDHPVIATIDRQNLGVFMAEVALASGASILTGATLEEIHSSRAKFVRKNQRDEISYEFLVGADGSHSRVRTCLGLGSARMGVGLNCMIEGDFSEMVWHLDNHRFGSGYGWIFPHKDRASFGAYSLDRSLPARRLKQGLKDWLKTSGIAMEKTRIRAGVINTNFSGWNFHPVFLVGDAAGLASPLTGEGIFPAIVSAEVVANSILGVTSSHKELEKLLVKRHKHEKMQTLASLNPILSLVLSELSALLLKRRMITFEIFEMA